MTEFNVILESFTDKVKTIKVVREITGQGLGEAKATVEGAQEADQGKRGQEDRRRSQEEARRVEREGRLSSPLADSILPIFLP